MLQKAIRQIKRLAATGTISVFAGGVAAAGWFCHWEVEHQRPYYNPSCEPNWGFHETNWRRIQSMPYGQQVSFCADGSCQTGLGDASCQGATESGGVAQGLSMQQQMIQRAPEGQAIILQQQPPHHGSLMQQPEYTTPGGSTPVFTPQVYPAEPAKTGEPGTGINMKTPAISEQQYPSQVFPSGIGVPLQIDGGNTGATGTSTLNPVPSSVLPSADTSGQAPTPMPMQQLPLPMPPIPDQSGYYQIPMNTVSQRAEFNRNNIRYSGDQQFAPTPQQRSRGPVRGISYGSTVQAATAGGTPAPAVQPTPARKFSLIPRFWSRGN